MIGLVFFLACQPEKEVVCSAGSLAWTVIREFECMRLNVYSEWDKASHSQVHLGAVRCAGGRTTAWIELLGADYPLTSLMAATAQEKTYSPAMMEGGTAVLDSPQWINWLYTERRNEIRIQGPNKTTYVLPQCNAEAAWETFFRGVKH